ncbi:hypothetical protein GGR53DRAFT_462084 [Hypoxylon sp. FL1150]|nr:hypothetical protein GGR53DRAFT_462084 [Hypoxylon sp. FL1150]
MCKQYVYITPCHNNFCEAILGSKKRNCYCSEARKKRRFGHCSLDVDVIAKLNDTKTCCKDCKYRQKTAAKNPCWQLWKYEENDAENCKTTATEVKGSDDWDEKSTTGSATTASTATTQFTSFFSAADFRLRPTIKSESPEPQFPAQTPVKPRGRKRKAVELLGHFESDLDLLEKEFGLPPLRPKLPAQGKRATQAWYKKQTQEKEEAEKPWEQEFTVVEPAPAKRSCTPRAPARFTTADQCPQRAVDDIYPYGFGRVRKVEAEAEADFSKRGTSATNPYSLGF